MDLSWLALELSEFYMSDGSYSESIALDVCSSAYLMYCRETGQKATVTWVEKSDSGQFISSLLLIKMFTYIILTLRQVLIIQDNCTSGIQVP